MENLSSGTAFHLSLAAINLVGLALMGWDKFQATRSGWRVPEKTLLGVAAIGGSLGVFAGMRLFRHKTRHWRFSVGVPIIMAAQIAVFYFLRNRGE